MALLCRSALNLKDLFEKALMQPALLAREDGLPLCRGEYIPAEQPDLVHPLDFNTLFLAELILGEDFRNVQIHRGPGADRLTGEAGAQALTGQNHIYFREGAYRPDTPEGQELLVHELTHAAQFAREEPIRFREDLLEREGEAEGKEFLLGGRDWGALERNGLAEESREEPVIRVIGRAGEEYFLTESELEEVKEEVKHSLADWLDREVRYYDEESRCRIMDRLFGNEPW